MSRSRSYVVKKAGFAVNQPGYQSYLSDHSRRTSHAVGTLGRHLSRPARRQESGIFTFTTSGTSGYRFRSPREYRTRWSPRLDQTLPHWRRQPPGSYRYRRCSPTHPGYRVLLQPARWRSERRKADLRHSGQQPHVRPHLRSARARAWRPLVSCI